MSLDTFGADPVAHLFRVPQAFPWLHAGQEGAQFVYQLLYLVDLTPYYSPVLHALRQRVVRVSGAELVRFPGPSVCASGCNARGHSSLRPDHVRCIGGWSCSYCGGCMSAVPHQLGWHSEECCTQCRVSVKL